MLIVFSGLPGTGKTTIASILCRLVKAVHIRIDSIEHALLASSHPSHDSPLGYVIGRAMALDNLRLGHIVVADCVNPVEASRTGWRSVADATGTTALDILVTCSDIAEHRKRVDTRTTDVTGLVKPTWDHIRKYHYEPWQTPPHRTLDTAISDPEVLARRLADEIATPRLLQ